MEQNFKNIIEIIKPRIARDIKTDDKALEMVLAAYNRMQDDERNGVDYIFDITNQEDLQYLVTNCGLCVNEIAYLWNRVQSEKDLLPYFLYGENYTNPHMIGTLKDLQRNMIAWLDELLPFVFKYVTRCEEYQAIYEEYVTEYLEKTDF
jgi:hypothetical protein